MYAYMRICSTPCRVSQKWANDVIPGIFLGANFRINEPSEKNRKCLRSATPPHGLVEGLTNAARGPLESGMWPEDLK